jgi:hypothetical protein
MDILGIHEQTGYYDIFFVQNDRLVVAQVYPGDGFPYNYADVVALLASDPALADFSPEQYAKDHRDLEQLRSSTLTEVEEMMPTILEHGFMYGADRIQADPVAQQNATGFLTALNAGVPVPFPIEWRTKANTSVFITDLAEFRVFSSIMLGFVQQVFHDTWKVKDDVRAATTLNEVDVLIAAYRGKYNV